MYQLNQRVNGRYRLICLAFGNVRQLDVIEIVPDDAAVDVTLAPKAGESIDRLAIHRCLGYTTDKLDGAK
jgi:hypothetical protein